MVVGSGMLANAFVEFTDDLTIVVFASGVSNSLEMRDVEFAREKTLLLRTIENNPDKKVIYFSTCSILDTTVNDRKYVIHKRLMEELITDKCDQYLICRVSNVVGRHGNSNTLMNYLYHCISNEVSFQAWINSERNILDVSDLVYFIRSLDELDVSNRVINVANFKSYNLPDIISVIERFTGKKAVYEPLDKGAPLNIDTQELQALFKEYTKIFEDGDAYLYKILNKYYPNA